MSASTLELSACAPGFEASVIPVWVADFDTLNIVWANEAALRFWNATSREELFARDVLEGAPARILEALDILRQRILAHEAIHSPWTFYPRGEPISALVDICPVMRPGGSLGLLYQVQSLMDTTSDKVQRSLALSRHSKTITALVAADGRVLTRNESADRCFASAERWPSWFEEPERGEALLARVLGGAQQTLSVRERVRSTQGTRWHQIDLHALRDPVSAELALLVEHRDETERVEAEALADTRGEDLTRLQAALDLVETQRKAILELSAPILDVGDATLAVALTGSFSAEQSEVLTAALLEAVSARRTRRVILDFTGLAQVDLALARRVESLVRCLELLGARPVITGIRPDLSRALVDADVALAGIPTLRSLAAGLRVETTGG